MNVHEKSSFISPPPLFPKYLTIKVGTSIRGQENFLEKILRFFQGTNRVRSRPPNQINTLTVFKSNQKAVNI
jgi:hypothetical protein